MVDGICRDFPGLHSLPYEYLLRRKTPRKIIDTFPFFNELDILEIRLRELSGVVAKFVLVESAQTHSGKPKDLLFEQNSENLTESSDPLAVPSQELYARACDGPRRLTCAPAASQESASLNLERR